MNVSKTKARFSLKLSFVLLMCGFQSLHAQWNFATHISCPQQFQHSTYLIDVDFVSPTQGIYSFSENISPSNGNHVQVNMLNAYNGSYTKIWNNNGVGLSSYAIKTDLKNGMFYHFKNNSGRVVVDVINAKSFKITGYSFNIFGYYTDAFVLDSAHIYLLHVDISKPQTYLSTHELGKNYEYKDTIFDFKPKHIFVTDTQTIYLAATSFQSNTSNYIYKSTTAGAAWQNIFKDTLVHINNLFFLSGQLGYAACNDGILLKTYDGGSSWNYLSTGYNQHINSIYFINDTIGYAACNGGLILKTLDGGATWHKQVEALHKNFTKIFFVSDTTGFAVAGVELFSTVQYPTQLGWRNNQLATPLVYPNPAVSDVTFWFDKPLNNATLIITDETGKTKHLVKELNGQIWVLPENSIRAGTYFYRIVQNNETLDTGKIVVLN